MAVLLIHGFTGHRSSLEALLPDLDQRHLPYVFPILAGHGTKPEDLRGKRWEHWQQDVESAFRQLAALHDHVIIVALSMGTLLAIETAVRHPDRVTGMVLLSPCIMFKNRLSDLTPIVSRIVPRYPFASKEKFSSKEFAQRDRGYPWFPTSAYRSYWTRSRTILGVAAQVHCPVRIIQSRVDRVADPVSAELLYNALPGEREILWHTVSGHEVLLDAETDRVRQEVLEFIDAHQPR